MTIQAVSYPPGLLQNYIKFRKSDETSDREMGTYAIVEETSRVIRANCAGGGQSLMAWDNPAVQVIPRVFPRDSA
jgi:hypothetical protein